MSLPGPMSSGTNTDPALKDAEIRETKGGREATQAEHNLGMAQGGTAQSLGETYSDPTGDGNPEREPVDGENQKSSFHGGNETPTCSTPNEVYAHAESSNTGRPDPKDVPESGY